MRRYEGLFIFVHTLSEEGLKEAIDKVTAELAASGAKIETVQKMEKRNFARVANKKHPAGYYVNFIFEAPPTVVEEMRRRLALNNEVFRVMFTLAPRKAAEATAPAA